MEMLAHLFVHSWVPTDQNWRQPTDHSGQAGRTKALIELRPTDNPVVSRDLQEGKHAPTGIGLKGLDLCDFHPFPPGLASLLPDTSHKDPVHGKARGPKRRRTRHKRKAPGRWCVPS